MPSPAELHWIRSPLGVQPLCLDCQELLCFLIGSGVSVAPPSCLPTGLELTQALLTEMVPSSELSAILAMTNWEESGDIARVLRFEQLVQLVSEVDPDLSILDVLVGESPNANHLALAHLALAGHRLFTTNFDTLLERALMSIAPTGSVYPVIFEPDWQRSTNKPVSPIYKLHGSLADITTGRSTRDSIQATLRQIARGKERGLGLEPWKREVLATDLRRADLIVVGYSGLDDFDVLPLLRETKSDRRIVWIEHVSGAGLEDAEVLTLSRSCASTRPTRAGTFLRSLAGSARRHEAVVRVRVDTMRLLAALAGSPEQRPYPPEPPRRSPSLALGLSARRKAFFAGEIYSYGYSDDALRTFGRALELARSDGDRMLEGRSLIYIARQHEASLQSRGKRSDPVESGWRDAKSALDAAHTILEVIPGEESKAHAASALNNLGMLYRHRERQGDLETARRHFASARALNEQIGNQRGEAANLNNLAAVDYALGDIDAAIESCARACKLDEALGDLFELATHLSNLGKYRCDAGQAQGEDLLLHAIELGEKLGSFDQVANTYNHLGRYYADHRRWRDALEAYESAVEIADRAGMVLVDSFRRSTDAVRSRLAQNEGSGDEGVPTMAATKMRNEPAQIDPASITGLIVLAPEGSLIADEKLTTFVIGCYSQLNEQLSAILAERGLWAGLEVGYGVCPPNYPEGMIGLAYRQAKIERERGKTVIIQGPIAISQAALAQGYPPEVWILTVSRTPAGQDPRVGFVPRGAVTPNPA